MRNFAKNPFLVLGVSADAEMTEIRRVAQRRMMECRLDGGENSSEARRVETALEQLQDPVQRFSWGLYWPELTAEEAERFRDDPVLSTLGEDLLQDSAAAYESICSAGTGEVRGHNLGVLSLLQAVAATEEAQRGTPEDISDDLACCEIWRRALYHLARPEGAEAISTNEHQRVRSEAGAAGDGASAAFWLRKRLWAKGLGDKRLSEARLQEIRNSYITEILAPAGAVVTTALLARHTEVAKAYVKVIRSSGFQEEIIEDTLSRVYKPLADRVERVVQGLSERAESTTSSSGLSALLSEFEREALEDLELMIAVGDLPGYAEEHARDTAATLLRPISIDAWNEADNAKIARRAIRLASRVADSESLNAQLAEDQTALEEATEGKKRMDDVAQLFASLERALAKKDLAKARRVVNQLIPKTSGQDQDKLRQLRRGLDASLNDSSDQAAANSSDDSSVGGCIVLIAIAFFIFKAMIES